MSSNEYLSGKKLYGDDLDIKEIVKWYKDEEEGYSSLSECTEDYEFHALNIFHGFSKIKNQKKFERVLGFGSAYGYELLPIINKTKEIIILEPSEKIRSTNLAGKKVVYKKPRTDGKIEFPDNYFDLITCFSVLHHIPNVSFVFNELKRVMKPGSFLLLREPTVSLGDWNKERIGLTKRERGIPLDILREIIKKNDFEIIYKRRILFPITRRIKLRGKNACNLKFFVLLDYFVSRIFSFNRKYHASNIFQKLQPQAIFYVLRKK